MLIFWNYVRKCLGLKVVLLYKYVLLYLVLKYVGNEGEIMFEMFGVKWVVEKFFNFYMCTFLRGEFSFY